MIGAILQARCRSSRLPRKVLLKLPWHGPYTVLEQIARRLSVSQRVAQLIVATTTHDDDEAIAALFPQQVYRGDEHHVLGRFYAAARQYQLALIVRLTGDNPCLDAGVIDEAIAQHLAHGWEYSHSVGLPLGMNVELFSFEALERAYTQAQETYDIEHVTPFMRRHPNLFKLGQVRFDVSLPLTDWRLTLDYPSDYALLNLIFAHFGQRRFALADLAALAAQHPWLGGINPNYQKRSFETEAQGLAQAADLLRQAELQAAEQIIRRELAWRSQP